MTSRKHKTFRKRPVSMLGVASATALMLAAGPATADLYARKSVDPVAAAVKSALQQAQNNSGSAASTRRAIESFQRASQIRQRMDAAQVAARAQAMAVQSAVPNGLGANALQVANGAQTDPSLWIGANGPTQTQADGRTRVEVDQTQARAILTWDSFNVGRETDLVFDQQGHTDWAVLNRVTDASADPSRILGSIQAQGSVMILNRNGVIFGGSSQVNARNITAAAATISNEQFLNRGIYSQLANSAYVPSFTDAGGAVTVEAGARLTTTAPKTVLEGGGNVLLLGTSVENAGSITSAKGQTLLAAGDEFLVRPGFGTESNQYSTTRGNEVRALIDVDSAAGTVTNTGKIEASQGDITLTGRNVVQDGILLSTTSVAQRGTIHLLNSAGDVLGSVTLTDRSLTAILPELDSEETAANAQRDALIEESAKQDAARFAAANAGRDGLAQFDNLSRASDRRDRSRVEIVSGGDVSFAAGSMTLAQGGQVSVSAADRIQTHAGALIDVSGVRDVMLDMQSNAIQVNVQGNELRDSPVNREQDHLKNENVWVDIRNLIYLPDRTGGYDGDRYYTPGGLLEVGGILANRQHSIGEWSAVGGTVTLAGNEVIAEQGSVFELSGGSLNYRSGSILSTRVQGVDGRLYDISDAPLGMELVSVGRSHVLEHERWGQQYEEVYSSGMFNRGVYTRHEDGYVVGRDAGQLVISAPTVVFEADVVADVITGERQSVARPDGVTDGYKVSQDTVARAGTMTIGRINGLGLSGAFDSDMIIGDIADLGSGLTDAPLAAERAGTVWLDAERLSDFGLGGLEMVTTGSIGVNEALTLTDGGALDFSAAAIQIDADVTIRSGDITIDNVAPVAGPVGADPTLLSDNTAQFVLGDGATLDLSGIWTNGTLAPTEKPSTAFVDGGNLSVRMVHGSVTLTDGSTVDVSSGGTLLGNGELIGGRGGDVSLIAGANRVEGNVEILPPGVTLRLDGNIRAQGVVGGGTLILQSPQTVVLGTDDLLASGVLQPGVALPADVILTAEVTIPAGTVLTMPASTTLAALIPDRPAPVFLVPDLQGQPIVIAGDWTVPAGVNVNVAGSFVPAGVTLPAGTQIDFFSGNIPAGTILPSSAFPQGFPVLPYTFTQQVGETTPVPISLHAGDLIPRGARFEQAVAFEPALNIDTGLLRSGFSDYGITSRAGLRVTSDAELRPEVPVLNLTAASFNFASGTDVDAVFESWLPPVYLEDPEAGRLHQREGASLSLNGSALAIDAGARIEVDPGERVRLASGGQLTVDGTIVAPGGDIIIVNDPLGSVTAARPGVSLWIGETAVLDAAGRSHVALDEFGRRYGVAQDGGSIRIGLEDYTRVDKDLLNATRAAVVIREGARLDASGAAADVDIAFREGVSTVQRPVQLAGDGGLIQLGSLQGLFIDGDLRAAGRGEGAAGGTLNLVLENSVGSGFGVRTVTLSQEHMASLPDDLAPGVSDPSLVPYQARISVEQIEAGGFGTLDLWSRDVIAFEGDVDLRMSESLIFRRGVLSLAPSTPDARVSLAASYVLLDGKVAEIGGDAGTQLPQPGLTANAGDYTQFLPSAQNVGSLSIDANLIDVRNAVFFGATGTLLTPNPANFFDPTRTPVDAAGFDEVRLRSEGDLRFTNGSLASGGDMVLTAAQLYPTTGAAGSIVVGNLPSAAVDFDSERTLTIRGYGETPAAPLSVFGSLTLTAPTIDQGGVVRAPLGRILFGASPRAFRGLTNTFDVVLRDGSVTSTSADGLLMPYGGTSDGLNYLYNGSAVSFVDLADLAAASTFVDVIERGVVMGQVTLDAEPGSLIDVSGGGELTGAGFFTGRGGSVDVLRTSLANANPAYSFSAPDAHVYAIVPSMQGDYAPVTPDAGAGMPLVGQQITLAEPVGELAAGTYTLMPSTYALLPGAFRVELGGTTPVATNSLRVPDGSFQATGHLSIANTRVRDALPTAVTITSADTVRTFSQYNETSYAEFAIANAATFGALRPRLERDALNVQIDFGQATGEVLNFDGAADLSGAGNGMSGNLFVTSRGDLEIKSSDASGSEGFASVNAADLSAFDAGTMVVGGIFSLVDAISSPDQGSVPLGPRVVFQTNLTDVVVRDGATLEAGQIFVAGQSVTIEGGAVLDTTAGPANGIDSSLGYVFSDSYNDRDSTGGAILAVANGFLNFTAPIADNEAGPSSMSIEDGATLRALGSISFSTSGALSVGEAELNARYLTLSTPRLNIGTAESFAAAEAAGVLDSGVRLSQATLDRLLRPDAGQVAVERLSLTAGEAINFFGDVDFNLRSAQGDDSALLVLNTPAIYGWGEEGDVARIVTDTLLWNGISDGTGTEARPFVSRAAGAVTPGGAGTGSGTLTVDARRIEFGYDALARPQDQVALDRLALGFSNVELNASERITANNRGTLTVYQTGVNAATFAGGELTLTTPLLAGEAGSFMAYRSGGALTVRAPEGSTAIDPATVDSLGAEVRLAGRSVTIDTPVALPSGRLVVEAQNDIALTERAHIDLSGRAVTFFDVTKHSWGGDLVMEAAAGAITQAQGSIINVSAEHADAGKVKFTATGAGGVVNLDGSLRGSALGDAASGSIDIRAQTLDDFSGVNEQLNDGGFFAARSFVVKSGDLTVGNEVQARQVTISADGGSLTIDGVIDAGGEDVGSIRLSSRDDLILTNNAVLDVHGTRLVTDSYGEAIEASNRGDVELTTTSGTIELRDGAVIDMRSADAISRGRLEINAPRIGGNDVAVTAASGISVLGADSIAVNAFASYTPADGIVNQGYLDAIHLDSTAFIDAANANSTVGARLAGLTAYGDAFHLRPGVEIRSATPDGDLTVEGDLDLSGYRYGPDVDGAIRGTGEPGVINIRAGGDLLVNGSINDGFAPPPATPDDDGWYTLQSILSAGQAASQEITFDPPFDSTTFFDYVYLFPSFLTGVDNPVVVSGSVTDAFATYLPGDTIPGYLYGTTTIAAGTVLSATNPANASIIAQIPEAGQNWAAAPMLAPGVLSWSMRLIGGADLNSADSRTVAAMSSLGQRGDVILESLGKFGSIRNTPALAVVRTGTGYLDVLAGGDYRQNSLFGVYTAGTQVSDSAAWDVGRALNSDGTILGVGNEGYEATLNAQRMYFTEHGGDLLLSAQGDVRAFQAQEVTASIYTNEIGNWLWRQGGDGLNQLTAWGINFGQYQMAFSSTFGQIVGFSGFSSIGTLGGGDVTVVAGGDAGATSNVTEPQFIQFDNSALSLVVGGSGRIGVDGVLTQTGGGTLRLDVGGRLNTGLEGLYASRPGGGQVVNLRGDIQVSAGSIGQTLERGYGLKAATDPRAADTSIPLERVGYSHLGVVVGDGSADVTARGDLNVVTALDAGRTGLIGGHTQAGDGMQSGTTSFTLWTERSGLELFAAGGDLIQKPFVLPATVAVNQYDPGRFSAVAASGSITANVLLAPSASGELELLAQEGLFGGAAMSSGSLDNVTTPQHPVWLLGNFPWDGYTGIDTNHYYDSLGGYSGGTFSTTGSELFTFGADTATDLHAGGADPIRMYAVTGDIVARTGLLGISPLSVSDALFFAAKPVHMRAGRDILANGIILNNDPDDISIVAAGRDILNSTLRVAGPGVLEVSAGRNIYQALDGQAAEGQLFALDSTINSIGPVVSGDARPGADVILTAGLGADGPDYAAFASLYLDPANLADPDRPLADQAGKVVTTYESELIDWLETRFGYEGTEQGALSHFLALPEEQQSVFLRDIYFEELRQGGREYNNPDSRRFGSYLRGRNAIASFLPGADQQSNPYQGSITFLQNAGVHTDFGGDIQVLAPGGGLTLGAAGVAPPATTGLMTQGMGNIEVYTEQSILLGLSRVFTTFGGSITMWSAEGDINAGRGAKGTIVYAPVRRLYDDIGNVALSPTVPTSGAGIGTLNPIPEVPAGDIDLIAPLGTIDAGEAGIRVSGNVNLAALQIVNAANIQVQGEATGLPAIVAVNTGALTAASSAASAVVNQVVQQAERARPAIRELPTILNVRFLGFGEQ